MTDQMHADEKVAQDTFQLPEKLKRAVAELALRMGFTRNVAGQETGNRARIYNLMVEYSLAHLDDFIQWRAAQAAQAVKKIVEGGDAQPESKPEVEVEKV
jgi:hypothetical protein